MDGTGSGRVRSALDRVRGLRRLGPALRRILPTLALVVAILTPAVAAGALAMRSGGEEPAPREPAAVLPGATGPTGPIGATGATGLIAAAPAAAPTGTTAASATASPRAGADYYRRTAERQVSASAEAGFLPLYKEAARVFGVDWRLIASVHRQETAFSSEPSTYRGLNAFGCCAGPMQFNVTNGPVSTWASYRNAFRQGNRPTAYPHPTRKHPSVYDDFDVMMAAGALLRDGGARGALDGGSWLAAYAYYGHDEFGVTYASQVLARALAWRRDGFAVNSADDPDLFARLEDAYGVFERQKLRASPSDSTATQEREARRQARRERRAKARRKDAAAATPTPRTRGSKKPGGAGAARAPRRAQADPKASPRPSTGRSPSKPSSAPEPTKTVPSAPAPAAEEPAPTDCEQADCP